MADKDSDIDSDMVEMRELLRDREQSGQSEAGSSVTEERTPTHSLEQKTDSGIAEPDSGYSDMDTDENSRFTTLSHVDAETDMSDIEGIRVRSSREGKNKTAKEVEEDRKIAAAKAIHGKALIIKVFNLFSQVIV